MGPPSHPHIKGKATTGSHTQHALLTICFTPCTQATAAADQAHQRTGTVHAHYRGSSQCCSATSASATASATTCANTVLQPAPTQCYSLCQHSATASATACANTVLQPAPTQCYSLCQHSATASATACANTVLQPVPTQLQHDSAEPMQVMQSNPHQRTGSQKQGAGTLCCAVTAGTPCLQQKALPARQQLQNTHSAYSQATHGVGANGVCMLCTSAGRIHQQWGVSVVTSGRITSSLLYTSPAAPRHEIQGPVAAAAPGRKVQKLSSHLC